MAADDSGVSDQDNLTRVNTGLTFEIPAVAGFGRLFRDGVLVASGTLSAASATRFDDPGPVPDGVHVYTTTLAASPTSPEAGPSSPLAVTVDTAGPRVVGVYVYGDAWSPAFKSRLEALGLGTAAHGYRVPVGTAQLDDLPWTNLNRISMAFSENVAAGLDDLVVRGARTTPGIYAYEQDSTDDAYTDGTLAGGFFANWKLASAIGADKLRLTLDGTSGGAVRDTAGNPLDGEWADLSGQSASVDGTAGGDFRFRLDVLPGIVDGRGTVNVLDYARTLAAVGRRPTAASVLSDVNAAGKVDALDAAFVRRRMGQQLSLGDPT